MGGCDFRDGEGAPGKLERKFKRYLKGQRVIVLGILDNYGYMEPALVELLKLRVTPHL